MEIWASLTKSSNRRPGIPYPKHGRSEALGDRCKDCHPEIITGGERDSHLLLPNTNSLLTALPLRAVAAGAFAPRGGEKGGRWRDGRMGEDRARGVKCAVDFNTGASASEGSPDVRE